MRDPIWNVLKQQGRHMGWLARVTGFKHGYVRLIACGARESSPAFRQACAKALDLPESLLFLPRTSTIEIIVPPSKAADTEREPIAV